MSIPEVIFSLLRTEETFSACLGQINTIIFKPLLQAGSFEKANVFFQLNECFQAVWDLTEENYRTLKETLTVPDFAALQDIYLIGKTDLFLDAYIQYFSTFTGCVVVQGFDHVARNKSDVWKLHKASLQGFLEDFTLDTSLTVALHTVLQKPFQDHLHQYSSMISRLKETVDQGPEKEAILRVAKQLAKLHSFVSQVLDESWLTRQLWKSLGHKLVDTLCTPERRLLEDSQNLIVFTNTDRCDRILLFNDILLLIQGNNFQKFDLKLVWVDYSISWETGKHALHICTPEEDFFLLAKEPKSRAVWRWKLNQAIRQALKGKRDFPLWGEDGEGQDPPLCRFSTFTFQGEGRLKNATYEGEWCLGKPHGMGKLTWPNGRNYAGDFKEGLEHRFGICLIPYTSDDRYDCYKCHWREGRMNGYGICEYGNETVYKGYFRNNQRQGFGILEGCSPSEQPFKYTGHWTKDKKNGYGIWDDKGRGERYIGMWHEDQRHGTGIVIMQSGMCYQRNFHLDKMVGKRSFLNGFMLEGTFMNKSRQGLQTQGILDTSREKLDDTIAKLQLGQEEFPVERRWEGLFSQFLGFVSSGGQGEMEEAFMGFHVQTSKELRKSQEYLFCERGMEEAPGKVDFLEDLVAHWEKEAMQKYLEQALENSLHPLGKLLKALITVFQATYSGIGANKHLLAMAQEEVKHYAKMLWAFYQNLLHLALELKGQQPAKEEESDSNGLRLLLPLILPSFYPELLMLYMLYHEKEDHLYCQGIVELSLFPDVKLLEFLAVQKRLWPLRDLTLTGNQRHSLVKDQCFLSATECLQKLITTVDPREKLDILQKTYMEIEKTVNRILGEEYNLPMDDLLPLLIYVVTRASIQHLGAEIHLIRDLMDPASKGGMHDFLLTALELPTSHPPSPLVGHLQCQGILVHASAKEVRRSSPTLHADQEIWRSNGYESLFVKK